MGHRRSRSGKKIIIAALVIIVVLASAIFAYLQFQKRTDNTIAPTNTVNYEQPTNKEQAAGDEQKQINDRSTDQDGSDAKPTTADVRITDAGQYDDAVEVRAYIANVFEEGTCTIKFTKGNENITRTTPAYPDSSYTICTNPTIRRSEFPSSGDWLVQVSFSSNSASGSSNSQTLTIK